jgi:cobalt-zinc-cadmium efflux system outer membrane protein
LVLALGFALSGISARGQEVMPPLYPASPASLPPLGLEDLLRMLTQSNPRLRQAELAIEAAQGRAIQAGLYPNPTVMVAGEELGGHTAPGGKITAPLVSQEIVTGKKLRLSRWVAEREVDESTLALINERFNLLTAVRGGFFEVLTAQRRVEILRDLQTLSGASLDTARKLFEAKQIARLDMLPFQVELNRFRADQDAAERELLALFRRLAASVGVPNLPFTALAASLDMPLPDYDFETARQVVLRVHPTLRSAQVAITRAQLALRRAGVEPIPNVTLAAGYQRNNMEHENQWRFEVGIPVPLFNYNQGNIRTAQAQLGQAIQEVARVENDLIQRLANAYGQYDAARQRLQSYRSAILPDTREAYRLSLQAFKGGQFDYLRVLQAQRALAEANLEYNRMLGEAWKAASEIAGFLLEEYWPAPLVAPPVCVPPVEPVPPPRSTPPR